MTEKRFTLAYEKGNWWAVRDWDITLWKEEVIHLLNELNDDNEQLKQAISDWKGSYDELYQDIEILEKENEQLKSELRTLRDFRGFITEKNVFNEKERKELQLQMLRLYNYFEDYFEDAMSPSSFSEMWDTVKESEKWEKRRC